MCEGKIKKDIRAAERKRERNRERERERESTRLSGIARGYVACISWAVFSDVIGT